MSAIPSWTSTRPHRSVIDHLGMALVFAIAAFSVVLLVVPSLIVVVMSFDTRSYISFPPQGFTFDWYETLLENRVLMNAMLISFEVGIYVTIICTVIGVPTALACIRGRFRGRDALSVFVLFPHMVPGIVLGVAVLFAGALVGIYPSVQLQVVTIAAFILGVTVRTVMARLQRLDPSLEDAATNLGASRWQTFRSITLPLLLPAIYAAGAYTFIEGFDNISVAIFTHGYRDRPLPIELFSIVQNDNSPLVAALSSVQILLAMLILAILSLTVGLDRTNE